MLNNVPGANWRAEFSKVTLAFLAKAFGGWLNIPDTLCYRAYDEQNATFSTMSYQNPVMGELIRRRPIQGGPVEKYKEEVEGFIAIAFDDVPRIRSFSPRSR